jgi:hypothetical protein
MAEIVAFKICVEGDGPVCDPAPEAASRGSSSRRTWSIISCRRWSTCEVTRLETACSMLLRICVMSAMAPRTRFRPDYSESDDRPILSSFDGDYRAHIVVPSAANDAARDLECAFFCGIERDYCAFSRLYRLIYAEFFDLKTVQNVLACDIQDHILAAFDADNVRFNGEFPHRNRDMNGRNALFSGACGQYKGA